VYCRMWTGVYCHRKGYVFIWDWGVLPFEDWVVLSWNGEYFHKDWVVLPYEDWGVLSREGVYFHRDWELATLQEDKSESFNVGNGVHCHGRG
jgi:hypothetical protein